MRVIDFLKSIPTEDIHEFAMHLGSKKQNIGPFKPIPVLELNLAYVASKVNLKLLVN